VDVQAAEMLVPFELGADLVLEGGCLSKFNLLRIVDVG